MSDTKIIQDMKVVQQILKDIPGGREGNNTINFVMIGNIGEAEGKSDKQSSFDLETFIDSLPDPRINNLIGEAVRIAHKRNPDEYASYGPPKPGAKWLGISHQVYVDYLDGRTDKKVDRNEMKRIKE